MDDKYNFLNNTLITDANQFKFRNQAPGELP